MNNNDVIKYADDAVTIAEHEAIILKYINTGILDRDNAIKKYIEFEVKNPSYSSDIEKKRINGENIIPLENMSNDDIIINLNNQLKHLCGKNLLEGLING